jgi:hypothetical protein
MSDLMMSDLGTSIILAGTILQGDLLPFTLRLLPFAFK